MWTLLKKTAIGAILKFVEWRIKESVKSDKIEDAAVREWLKKMDAKYEKGKEDEAKD